MPALHRFGVTRWEAHAGLWLYLTRRGSWSPLAAHARTWATAAPIERRIGLYPGARLVVFAA